MPSGFRTLEFSDLDRKTIDAWRSQGIVFLVGSLVSGYPPTNLPLGSEISSALCKWLFPEFPGWLQQDVKRLPFEALMELYPDQSALPSIVKTVFNFDTLRPNKVHSTLASSLLEDKIRGLITTNYDLGFEVCFRENPRVSTVDDRASFERYRSADSKQAIYLKLHGTAKAGKEHTLVYKLTHEGRLQDWKKDLLRELLQDRVLVVAGYSGCDFDICPVLARETGQRLTVWLQRPDKPQDRQEPQANARRVVENRDGFFLAADFIDFLEEVLDKRCEDCLALGRSAKTAHSLNISGMPRRSSGEI